MSESYLLGIDTGGTYTDGALLDQANRQILQTTKTLTTHHDLMLCILQALDDLLPADPGAIKLVAISTTLATNAIAEGKGRPTGLILIGYDQDLVRTFHFERDFATPHFAYFEGGHRLTGEQQAPLDVVGIRQWSQEHANQVEGFAISSYFSPFNPQHEERAFQILQEGVDHPVVLGHQLSSQLNSIQRATTATLNASLMPVLKEFMTAMAQALHSRGVAAPLMVMRGDGALMRASAAQTRPVETVHSGPAASAIGGHVLAGRDSGLVIDIGGTTTDLAILNEGRVIVDDRGTSVGPYPTAVRAARVRSIGLGGDSRVSFDVEDRLQVGPHRVIPLARLAHEYPRVKTEIESASHRFLKRPTADHLEYWLLLRDPRSGSLSERARDVVRFLEDGPRALSEILQHAGVIHPIQFDGSQLLREEVISRSGLTPTDLLHITGEYSPWDQESARTGASFLARLQGWTVEELVDRVKEWIAVKIATEVVEFTTGQRLGYERSRLRTKDLGSWLFRENLQPSDPILGSRIHLKSPIIGIGAPAGIFLPRVAEILHTELQLPEHHEVANAVGAVVGSVMTSVEGWVYPQLRGLNVIGYHVVVGDNQLRFSRLDKALDAARDRLSDMAQEKARDSGAVDPQVEVHQLTDGAESFRLRAVAFGNPELG